MVLLFAGRAVLRLAVLFMLLWLLSIIYNYVIIYKPKEILLEQDASSDVIENAPVQREILQGELPYTEFIGQGKCLIQNKCLIVYPANCQ